MSGGDTETHCREHGHYGIEACPRCEVDVLTRELKKAHERITYLEALYDTWGFKDAPCPAHSKPSLLVEDCAVCRAERAEAELSALQASHAKLQEDYKEVCNLYRSCSEDYNELESRVEEGMEVTLYRPSDLKIPGSQSAGTDIFIHHSSFNIKPGQKMKAKIILCD